MGTERLTAMAGRVLPASLRGSETAQAAGLAGAALAANVLALVFTVVFARLLGAEDYGSLAALVSTFLILSVPGAALQVAVARETALGRLGRDGVLTATVGHWVVRLSIASVAVLAASVLLREQLGSIVGVKEEWAAAGTLPAGCCWLLLCVMRGVLQGLHGYRAVGLSIVGEAVGRLAFGLVLFGAGAGVTGAYLGTPLSMLAAAGVLVAVLRARTGPSDHGPERRRLRTLTVETWGPVAGLTLIAVLQNVDVIVVKHQIGGDSAGSYAAAAVAAKAIVWVAIGVGFHLVPETARRTREGEEARPALRRALAIVGALAVPAMAIFALVPHLLLEVAFGSELTEADAALPVLGVAMSLLACSYLVVQYLLALGRRHFLVPLAALALLEPVLLLATGVTELVAFAAIVLCVQAATAAALLAFGARTEAAGDRLGPAAPTPPAPTAPVPPAPNPAPGRGR
ncbi:MAG: oligosaccharide flippase family protein [Solirubrobacteraceae bacterium]